MYALIAIGIALVLLVILLRLKVRLGPAMIIAAVALAILLRVTPAAFWQTLVNEWQNERLSKRAPYMFVTLSALVILVNVLGISMKEARVTDRLAPALHGLFRSRRLALAAVPFLMGMLPTPGGIMLSAPIVKELADRIGVDRSKAAAINLLFRHQWETIWPLYPAIPFIQNMFGVSAIAIILHNLPIMLAGVIGGAIFILLTGIPPKDKQHRSEPFKDNLRNFAHALWPIILVAVLYVTLDLTPALGMLLVVVLFLLFHRISFDRWSSIFKAGIKIDYILLIGGALIFKVNLNAACAVDSVVLFLQDMNIPPHVFIFFLPMLVSFMLGLTFPTVAITFPFFVHFTGTGPEAKLGLETLAFAGLMCGILITPVHLCVTLSADYFETPLLKVVVKLLAPLVFVAAAGFIMAWLFG
jgi:integral membrane protein (TIGR00529 family)